MDAIIYLMFFLAALPIGVFAGIQRCRYLSGKHLRPRENSGQLWYRGISDGRITRFDLGIEHPNGVAFLFTPKGAFVRLLEQWRIVRPLRLGDEALDEKFFFAVDLPSQAHAAVATPRLIELLHHAVSLQARAIQGSSNRSWYRMRVDEAKHEASHFEPHIAILRELSDIISKARAGLPRHQGAALRSSILIASALHLGILTSINFTAIPFYVMLDGLDTVSDIQLLIVALGAGVGAAALWWTAMLSRFRLNLWRAWIVADFVKFGIPGFLLAAPLFVKCANVYLPQGPPREVSAQVTSTLCHLHCVEGSGKNRRTHDYNYNTTGECAPQNRATVIAQKIAQDDVCKAHASWKYLITVQHWAEDGTYTFAAPEELYDRTSAGAYIPVSIQPGALGIEWIEQRQFMLSSEELSR